MIWELRIRSNSHIYSLIRSHSHVQTYHLPADKRDSKRTAVQDQLCCGKSKEY